MILWVAGGIAVLLLLDRLLLYAERRGWIYYRRKKPSSSALSHACLEVQQLLEPSKNYVVLVKKCERRDRQSAGDLPPREESQDFGVRFYRMYLVKFMLRGGELYFRWGKIETGKWVRAASYGCSGRTAEALTGNDLMVNKN